VRAVGDERSETEHRIPLLTGSAGEDVRSEKKIWDNNDAHLPRSTTAWRCRRFAEG